MSASDILQHMYSLDISSPGISRLIYRLIRRDKEEQYLSSLQGPELARLVDFLDRALDVIPTTDVVFPQCLHKLRAICGHRRILPSSYTVSGDLIRVSDGPIAWGGSADVWKGTQNGREVSIKELRIPLRDDRALLKSFSKEVVIWKWLRHPNIVPFIGVTMKPLQIVSEWMPNGTLTRYVEKHPSVNRIGLLLDVAEGLTYLHGNHTIHGDLKGPNILVDGNGHARLTDFGYSSIIRGANSVLVTQPQGWTEEWTAPEILMGASDRITWEADIFAFGMVVIEAFTGRYPFSNFKSGSHSVRIINGQRPNRPQGGEQLGLVDPVWDLTVSCWQQDPSHRPKVVEVVRVLHEHYVLSTEDSHLDTVAPGQPAESPTPTQSPESSRNSSQLSFQSYSIPADLRSLPDETHVLPGAGNPSSRGASIVLEGVVQEEDHSKDTLQAARIWKGGYGNEAVALKALKIEHRLYREKKAERRIFQEAVLMMRLKHDNIRPFYGVSTIDSDFCLVFPWYENGNIIEYLNKRPDANRFVLLSDVANGLRFLHENNLVHGALKPGRILIDDSGTARLDTVDRNSILAILDVSVDVPMNVDAYIRECRYSAPEVMQPNPSSTYKNRKGGDVYGMGMVIYEVLTGDAPYSEHTDWGALSRMQVGEIPQRPSHGIHALVWEFLEKCWSRDPAKRPSATEAFDTLSQFHSLHPVPTRSTNPEELRFGAVERLINETAEALAGSAPWRESVTKLTRLCGLHGAVPELYTLKGVVKQGARAQHASQTTEIWKGRYDAEVVALKVFVVPRGDPHEHRARRRFCEEVVLMKQVEHKNILPFYGVSTTVSDFCLVFPWYGNGNIIEYLEKKPHADRFALLSNAASGLCFLHENHLVHGALRPSHILVDDNGTARLATASRSSIVAVTVGDLKTDAYINKYRYSAPEILSAEDRGAVETLVTKESDAYGMGMVAYEVLTGRMPYSECDDIIVTLSKIQARETPLRPSGRITDAVWDFLEDCWNGVPRIRPPTTRIYDAFSKPDSLLPRKLSLRVHSINFLQWRWVLHRYSIRFKYENQDHLTSPTKEDTGNIYIWKSPETWLITTSAYSHQQLVTFEVVRVEGYYTKVCGGGSFSLLDYVNRTRDDPGSVMFETVPGDTGSGELRIALT